MPKYTFDQVRIAATNASMRFPSNFRYVQPEMAGTSKASCFYTVEAAKLSIMSEDDPRLKTGCLVGTIFADLGEDVSAWRGVIRTILEDRKGGDLVDGQTVSWLVALQTFQDGGRTWHDAINAADVALACNYETEV